VREAFRPAQQEWPGLAHLELLDDIAHEETADIPLMQRHPIDVHCLDPADPLAQHRMASLDECRWDFADLPAKVRAGIGAFWVERPHMAVIYPAFSGIEA